MWSLNVSSSMKPLKRPTSGACSTHQRMSPARPCWRSLPAATEGIEHPSRGRGSRCSSLFSKSRLWSTSIHVRYAVSYASWYRHDSDLFYGGKLCNGVRSTEAEAARWLPVAPEKSFRSRSFPSIKGLRWTMESASSTKAERPLLPVMLSWFFWAVESVPFPILPW